MSCNNIKAPKKNIKITENLTKGLQLYLKKYKIIITKDLNNIIFNYNKKQIKIKKETYNKIILNKRDPQENCVNPERVVK